MSSFVNGLQGKINPALWPRCSAPQWKSRKVHAAMPNFVGSNPGVTTVAHVLVQKGKLVEVTSGYCSDAFV